MSSNAVSLNSILKRVYPPKKMERLFSRKRILHAKIEAKMQELDEGLEFWYPVHTGGTVAGGHVPEMGRIPQAQAQRTSWMKFNMATYLHTIGYSGQFKTSTRSKAASAARGVKFIVDSAIEDARDDMAIAHFTPASGLKCKCRTIVTNTTAAQFYVDNPYRLKIGERIVVALLATPATVTHGIGGTTDPGVLNTDFATITNITQGGLVTISTTLSGTPLASWNLDTYGDADYGVFGYYDWLADQTGSGTGQYAGKPFGLEDIVSDANPVATNAGNYGQVDRTSAGNAWAQGRVYDLGGNRIDHDIAEEALEMVSVAGNGDVSFWICDHPTYREIKKLHYGDKRATYKEKVGNNWFTAARLADLPVFPDRFCTARTIYGIDESKIEIKQNLAFSWVDDDNSMWSRIADRWAFEALGARIWQLCATPNCHVRIKNVYADKYVPSA